MLLCYELQKMISKRANQIAFLLLVLLIAYTCRSVLIQVEWIDEEGSSITGHAAAEKLREATQEWSGLLDQTMLEKALFRMKEIYSTTQMNPASQESNWILHSKIQGFQDIADLFCWTYLTEDCSFAEMVNALQPEALSQFYENRTADRRAWLYEDLTSWGYYNYTPLEKQYILEKFESFQTPLETGYHEGWVQVIRQLPTLLEYGMILLSFVLAGIFSDEFSWKTDAVYYNTRHGRTKATAVKVAIGFFTVTAVYWLCVGVYSLIVLGNLGFDSGHCSIQIHGDYWGIREQISFRQLYLLSICVGYLGYLFVGFLVLWLSAKTRSPVLAILFPSLLLLLPELLQHFYSPAMRRIIGLLPDKLMDIGEALRYLYLYTIDGRVMTAIPILVTVYPCITVFLAALCYREYRHKQIS